jgi:Transposase domain (DUF772)
VSAPHGERAHLALAVRPETSRPFARRGVLTALLPYQTLNPLRSNGVLPERLQNRAEHIPTRGRGFADGSERLHREVLETGRLVLTEGRPAIAMETYVTLMVPGISRGIGRWSEVSDSIHLRRFCRIALSDRVPDESTIRKLTRRVGAETVNELTGR